MSTVPGLPAHNAPNPERGDTLRLPALVALRALFTLPPLYAPPVSLHQALH